MTDDLIKRLRAGEHWPKTCADRIEELIERNKELTLQLLATSGQAADALDKIAKAMEVLRPFADVLKGNYFHQPDTMPISMGFGEYDRRLALKLMDFRNARTVLAELEGGK
jgi:hypothetical protein